MSTNGSNDQLFCQKSVLALHNFGILRSTLQYSKEHKYPKKIIIPSMGQAVMKLFSVASREVKMYNIEKRAEKVISRDKPTPAPMYQSTIEELERLNSENVSKEYLQKKDQQLDDYLKKVYVTTPDPAPSVKRVTNPERPMPQNRSSDLDVSYGYSESEEKQVPVGQVSLKQALKFISDHQTDPKVHSSSAIAAQYKLRTTATDDILEHFKMFNLRMNEKEVDPEKLSSYQRLQYEFKKLNMDNVADVMKKVKETVKSKSEPTSKSAEVEAVDEKKDSEREKQLDSRSKKHDSNEKG